VPHRRPGVSRNTPHKGPNAANDAFSAFHLPGVGDLDGDGRAEVALRIANGVTFGDGTTWTHADNARQFMAVLDGRTGALRNWAAAP
jgi:rhamnogalacturonan endolyase